MKISFVATVFNEEKTIRVFLDSLYKQTKMPDEIIIVDGGSSDLTVAKIRNPKSHRDLWSEIRNRNIKLRVYVLPKSSIAAARNYGIKKASGNIIVCSDAGCVLNKEWIENITKPFKDKSIDVVAGYYKGKPKSVFEKCLIPYVLVSKQWGNL